MADIFIAYSQADRHWVGKLALMVEREGFSVWWDVRLLPGDEFEDLVLTEINAAKCVLVVWSRHSINSDWVYGEADEARRSKKLVPVFKEAVSLPTAFRKIHTADLSQWDDQRESPEFAILLDAIRGRMRHALEKQGTQARTTTPYPQTSIPPVLPDYTPQSDVPPPNADIFISYSRANKDRVEPLASKLEEAGFSVWWDPQFHSGDRIADVIQQQLANCKCVIVVWSKLSVISDWVRDEASEARKAGKLLPILLEPVEPPLAFRSLHASDFSDWRGVGHDIEFEKLCATIRARVKHPVAAPPPPAQISFKPGSDGSGSAYKILHNYMLAYFGSKLSRKKYIQWLVLLITLLLVAGQFVRFLLYVFPLSKEGDITAFASAIAPIQLCVFVVTLSLVARRLNDAGFSGWYAPAFLLLPTLILALLRPKFDDFGMALFSAGVIMLLLALGLPPSALDPTAEQTRPKG